MKNWVIENLNPLQSWKKNKAEGSKTSQATETEDS